MSKTTNWTIGIHPVTTLLERNPEVVELVQLQAGRNDKRVQAVRDLLLGKSIQIEEVDKALMDRQHGGVHQGVAARHSVSKQITDEKALLASLAELDHPPFILVLDSITDPHNLGACLRTADAAGVDAVIVPKDNSASMNATVSKVASGAAETVSLVTVTNLARCIQALRDQGLWVVGTSDDAEIGLYQQDLTGPLVLVMGSEGDGLRRLTREHCDFLVSILMAGVLSSLNVSVAAGICLFEAVRQRQGAK